MVYNEDAYREVFPEVKVLPVIEKPAEHMIEEEPEPEKITEPEKELIVEAPQTVREGVNDDTGSSDTTD